MSQSDDTLVARMTPPGRSALATIVIHGPHAAAIAARLFPRSGRIAAFGRTRAHYHGTFGEGITDDVVLAVVEPERTIEVHCHGGPAVVEALIGQIRAEGAVEVGWRELLRRQGWHETRIEAAEALSRSSAAKAAAILLDQFHGSLEQAFERIEKAHDRGLARELMELWDLGRHLVAPWRVVLLGRPNVGKSSLLNTILGFERVIVSPIPGTTRDVIEVEAALDGWPVRLSDGAGLRESSDAVERAGVERIQDWARSADLRIFLRDLSEPPCEEDEALIDSLSAQIVIGNKSDLVRGWPTEAVRRLDQVVSAKTGEGVAELIDAIVKRVVPGTPEIGQAVPFTQRQAAWLSRWRDS